MRCFQGEISFHNVQLSTPLAFPRLLRQRWHTCATLPTSQHSLQALEALMQVAGMFAGGEDADMASMTVLREFMMEVIQKPLSVFDRLNTFQELVLK